MHQVPGKLTWGAWAFAHASALTPDGPRPSDGAYVSWLNNGDMELLSDDDVTFVGGLLDRAETSAATLENVYGPVLVYHRQSMAALATTSPDDQVGEWIDDQAGLLMKWGVPILAATRTEWLGSIDGDRQLISQPPIGRGRRRGAARPSTTSRSSAGPTSSRRRSPTGSGCHADDEPDAMPTSTCAPGRTRTCRRPTGRTSPTTLWSAWETTSTCCTPAGTRRC